MPDKHKNNKQSLRKNTSINQFQCSVPLAQELFISFLSPDWMAEAPKDSEALDRY